MDYQVFLNEKHQIELIFGEKLNEEELKTMLKIANQLITKMKKENIPINILADVSKLNKLSIGARSYGSSWLLKQPINKVAVFGDNLFMKYFIRMLSAGLGLNKKISFFKSKKEAQKWL